jgi:hypothetical protein
MNDTLLQAENEALKARIKFLELKLSLQEQKPQEPKKKEFIEIGSLVIPQLRMLAGELGQYTSSGWRRYQFEMVFTGDGGEYVAGFRGLSREKKMKAIVKVVKDLHSRGLHKDIIIHEKACN